MAQKALSDSQRYVLSVLKMDGALDIVKGNRLVRHNGLHVGFKPSAQALIAIGLARTSDDNSQVLLTAAGKLHDDEG